MRKMIWIGVAAGVLCGTGAYFAACHAAKHPDCFLARCANLAGYVGARCGAVLSFNQTANCPAKPVTQVVACDEQPALLQEPRANPIAEPIEPIIVETIDPSLVPAKAENAVNQELTRANAVEAQTPFMPYADEPKPQTASATESLIEGCWNFFTGLLPVSAAQQTCPSDCFVRMSVKQFHECVKALHQETVQEFQVQVEDTSTGGQANPVLPPDLFPQMIVDPHHHHHYPSCPYTGRCPAPMPSFPRLGNVETPRSTPSSPVPRNEALDLFTFWYGLFR